MNVSMIMNTSMKFEHIAMMEIPFIEVVTTAMRSQDIVCYIKHMIPP